MLQKSIKSLLPTPMSISMPSLTCFIVPSLFTPQECQQFLAQYVPNGFHQAIHNYPTYYRNNERIVVDSAQLARTLFDRIRGYLPQKMEVGTGARDERGVWKLKELNDRIRFCRYGPQQYFNRHLDGIHYRNPTHQSKLTFMVYLNSAQGNFTGGRTLFYANQFNKQIVAAYVPKIGDLIIFDHNLWHEGEKLETGEKFVMRTDIVYERIGDGKVEEKDCMGGKQRPKQRYGQGHSGYIWTLLQWDSQTLITGGRDKTIKVWNTPTGSCKQTIPQAHSNSVFDLIKLNPNTLISCSRDKNIAIWKYEDGKFGLVTKFIAHGDSTVLTLLRLNDEIFASGGADFRIRLFEGVGGKMVGELLGHQNWVWKMVKIDQEKILSCSEDGTVRMWSWKEGKQLLTISHTCSVLSLAYSQKDNKILMGDLHGNITCYTLTPTPTKHWTIPAHKGLIRHLELIPSATAPLLASCSEDGFVKVWNTATLEEVYAYRHENFVQDVCYDRGRGVLVSASYDGRIVEKEFKLPV